MSAIVSADDLEKLVRPHVARVWFGQFDFPDGMKYLHSSVGAYVVDGHEYLGVSDPMSGRLVGIDQVDEPRFGQAAAVSLALTGASVTFIQQTFTTARQIEGRIARLFWAAFDAETLEMITSLIPVFTPYGIMSAPRIRRSINQRYVTLTVESIWSAQNYAPGGRWNGAGQRQRFPGDKGLDFVGVDISENWQ